MSDENNEQEKAQDAAPSEPSEKAEASSLPVLPSWNVRGQFNRKSAAFTSGIRIPKMDASLLRKEEPPAGYNQAAPQPTSQPNHQYNQAAPATGPQEAKPARRGGEDTVPPGALKRPIDLRSRNILPKPGTRPTLAKLEPNGNANAARTRLPGPPLPNQQKITDPDLPIVAAQLAPEPTNPELEYPSTQPKLELQTTSLSKDMQAQRTKQSNTGDLPAQKAKTNGQHESNALTEDSLDAHRIRTNALSRLGKSQFATGTKSASQNPDSFIANHDHAAATYFATGEKSKRTDMRELRY